MGNSKEIKRATIDYETPKGNIILEFDTENKNSKTITIKAKTSSNQTIGYTVGRLKEHNVECEYSVDEDYRGNGIAGKMLQELLYEVFVVNPETKNVINKAVLNIDVENFSSRRVAEKQEFNFCYSENRDSVEYEISKEQFLKTRNANKKLGNNLDKNISDSILAK